MTAPSKPQSLWKRIYAPIKYIVTFATSNKQAMEPCLDNDRVNKTSVDCENPLDKHCNDLLQSITTAPSKVPLWKHFFGVLKSYLAVIIPNKHATKPRLADECLNKGTVECESPQILPSPSRGTYDQVFITDSDEIYQWASKDTLMFRLFKSLERYSVFRFFLSGLISINPCWRSVLWIDEVINKNEPVEVTDTLILHCQSIETYSKVIPRIHGSYNRLILHGHISWDQIKQLIHPGVKQVRINAEFDMNSAQHVEFVCFIMRFCRGLSGKFSIVYEAKCPKDLLEFINRVVEYPGGTHCLLTIKRGTNVISVLHLFIYLFCCLFVILSHVSFFGFMDLYFAWIDGNNVCCFVTFIIDLIVIFWHMRAAPNDVKNNDQHNKFTNTLISP